MKILTLFYFADKPIFQQQRKSEIDRVAFDIGDTAHIPCRVQAFPKPEFDWSYNQLILSYDAKHTRPYESNLTILANDIYVSTLIVHGVQRDDYGEYKCKASNTMGNGSTIIVLQERGAPSPPSKLTVLESGMSSLTLKWESGFDGGYDDTKFVVNAMDENSFRDVECQSSPCNVTGLQQQSVYTIRVSLCSMLHLYNVK